MTSVTNPVIHTASGIEKFVKRFTIMYLMTVGIVGCSIRFVVKPEEGVSKVF